MMNLSIYRVILISALWLASPTICCAQRAGSPVAAVTRFDKVQEIVDSWTPERQLYVRGDLGVGQRQLTELAAWLREQAPHWTVVLMQNAEGQRYSAADGHHYRDMDAVESALGKDLNNKNDFGQLVNRETEEPDGAIFILFLQERQFSYYGSEAQDSRNLGDDNWIGELDQPAIRAMRNGGRILDAVKDTIENINSRLQKAIAAEKNAQLRVTEQRQRQMVQLQTRLSELTSEVERIAASSQEFVSRHPEATGQLAKPPIAQWSEKLNELQSTLAPEPLASEPLAPEVLANVEGQSTRLNSELMRYQNAYAAGVGFEQHAQRLQQEAEQLAQLNSEPLSRRREQLLGQLATATAQLKAGDISFLDTLNEADSQVTQAQTEVTAFTEQQQLAQMRALWVRRTVIVMLWIFGAVIALVLWLANRRRAATMHKAVEQWTQRNLSTKHETDQLDKLFQRNDEVLGSRERIDDRGYTGQTRALALKAFDYVDDLFIMSKEVKRVLSEAHRLIYPRDPWGQVINLFSGQRFQAAMDHITGSPLTFQRATGIPLIVRDMNIGQVSTQQTNGIPDEVKLTFEEIFSAFQKRGVEAGAALTTIEHALSNVQDLLTQNQQRLQAATAQEKELDAHAASDGLLDVPHYFETLIPAIQSNLHAADDLAAFDAVQAVEGPLATAQRQLSEAMELGQHLLLTRQELFPKLLATAQSLKELGYASPWIGDELNVLSQRADQLMQQAGQRPISSDVQALIAFTSDLETRSEQVLTLGQQIQQLHLPKQADLAAQITETRADLAKALQLPTSSVLHELDHDPDDLLQRARSSLDAARAMLIDGRVTATGEALATFTTAIEGAYQILTASKAAVKNYHGRTQQLNEYLAREQQRLPKLRSDTADARQAYAASALLITTASVIDLSTAAPAQVDEPVLAQVVPHPVTRSLDWYLETADHGHSDIARLLKLASENHSQGRLLAAAAQLDDVQSILATVDSQLDQVVEHLARLESQTQANITAQQRNESQLESLQSETRNPLVTMPTISAIKNAAVLVSGNRQMVLARQAAPNPFEAAHSLMQTQRQLEQLQAQIVGDEQAHAETRRALQGARQQLQQSNQLVRQSQTDGIPDSPRTIEANSRIAELAQQLNQLERDLEQPHGDWRALDQRAAQVQANLAAAAQALGGELSAAGQALAAFQQASQVVLQAGQWAGPWGVRVSGSPGVTELERARSNLQGGNYDLVLQVSRVALLAAQAAIQQAEREVARRRMEEERQREAERRRREAAERSRRSNSGGSFGGGSFGGSVFGSSRPSSSTSSRPSSSTRSSGASGSGFKRSGW